MIEFGSTLRRAREAKGYTKEQIAEMTHIMVQYIDDLENENFSRIVAPIYGRGFVKLYCEAIGLDPKEMVAEFMELYTGKRPVSIRLKNENGVPIAPREKVVVTASAPEAPAIGTAPPVSTTDLFGAQNTPPAETAPRPSRYAQIVPIDDDPPLIEKILPLLRIPKFVWRLGLLACVGAAILWALCIGISSLRKATAPKCEDAEVTQAPAKTNAAEAKTDREQVKIPSLYID